MLGIAVDGSGGGPSSSSAGAAGPGEGVRDELVRDELRRSVGDPDTPLAYRSGAI